MPTGEKQDSRESAAGRNSRKGKKRKMMTVAKDGSGDFSSIQAAVDSIPERPGENPVHILVRAGEYREKVVIHRDNVVLTGGQIGGAPGNTNTIKVEKVK